MFKRNLRLKCENLLNSETNILQSSLSISFQKPNFYSTLKPKTTTTNFQNHTTHTQNPSSHYQSPRARVRSQRTFSSKPPLLSFPPQPTTHTTFAPPLNRRVRGERRRRSRGWRRRDAVGENPEGAGPVANRGSASCPAPARGKRGRAVGGLRAGFGRRGVY